MNANQLTPLWGAVFWLVLLVYLVAGPLRRNLREKKQQAILDRELSGQDFTRQRQGHAAARRLSLDCLAVLGVPEDASQAEIDRAWRRKAGKVQPEGRGDIFPFWRALD